MTVRWRGPLDRPGVRALLGALPGAGVTVDVRHLGKTDLLEVPAAAARAEPMPAAAPGWDGAVAVTDLAGGVRPAAGRAAAEAVWLPGRPGPDLMGAVTAAAEVWARDAAGVEAALAWGVPSERVALVPEPLAAAPVVPPGRRAHVVRAASGEAAVRAVAGWVAAPADPGAVLVVVAAAPGLALEAAIRAATPDPGRLPEMVVVEEPPDDPRVLAAADEGTPAPREVAALVAARLGALAARPVPPRAASAARAARRPLLAISGVLTTTAPVALRNRALARALLARGDVEVALIDRGPGALAEDPEVAALLDRAPRPARPPDLLVRADLAARFPGDAVPTASLLSWGTGDPPEGWAEAACLGGEEVWTDSPAAAAALVAAGVPAARVVVLPAGADTATMRPDGPAADLGPRAGTRYLYAGGLGPRDGAGPALDAWERAVGAGDPATLVVQRLGEEGPEWWATGRRLAGLARAGDPRVVVLDDAPSDARLAAVMRACDCLLAPCPGPAGAAVTAAAMACGLAVVAPADGTLVDEEVAVPLGDGGDPVAAMRRVAADPAAARAAGRRAAARMRDLHGWGAAAAAAAARAAHHAGGGR